MEIILENIPEVELVLKTTGQMYVDFKVAKRFSEIYLYLAFLGLSPKFFGGNF